jgi:hypothetical protein
MGMPGGLGFMGHMGQYLPGSLPGTPFGGASHIDESHFGLGGPKGGGMAMGMGFLDTFFPGYARNVRNNFQGPGGYQGGFGGGLYGGGQPNAPGQPGGAGGPGGVGGPGGPGGPPMGGAGATGPGGVQGPIPTGSTSGTTSGSYGSSGNYGGRGGRG